MFVSEDEARDRLASRRNLLREPDDSSEIEQSSDARPVEVWPEPEIDDITLPCISNPDTLESLQDLIGSGSSHTSGRAHYKGHRQVQKAIAETDLLLGPSLSAKILGLSVTQAHAYGNGQQTSAVESESDKVIDEVRSHIELVKLDIAQKATSKLSKIIDAINGPRIDAIENPMDLAHLGRDMATIIEKVSPRTLSDTDHGVMHIYRPETSDTKNYNIVNINVGARQREELSDTEANFLKRTLDPTMP